MSKIIDFPTKEKRIARLLREQLPFELPAEAIEELATELQAAAEKIDHRPKSFQLMFPDTFSPGEVEFITRQVEGVVGELMDVIKGEENEIFSLIIRCHLLRHHVRQE